MQHLFQTIFSLRLAKRSYPVLLFSILLLVLAACGPADVQVPDESVTEQAAELTPTVVPLEEETDGNPAEQGYPPPPPVLPTVQESYPAETLPLPTATSLPDVYPAPTIAEVFAEPRIRLDLPVRAGSSMVTGQAPPGLVLALVDVTYNGALLGTGTAGSDGRFTIDAQGLLEGNRLGVTFGELEPGLSLSEMSVKYYPHRGEGFMNLPNVGVMLDTTLIEP